jgi:hypothetical protein
MRSMNIQTLGILQLILQMEHYDCISSSCQPFPLSTLQNKWLAIEESTSFIPITLHASSSFSTCYTSAEFLLQLIFVAPLSSTFPQQQFSPHPNTFLQQCFSPLPSTFPQQQHAPPLNAFPWQPLQQSSKCFSSAAIHSWH